MYDNYNGASVCMHIAAEGTNWLNREFLWFMFFYPFVQMGVKVAIGIIPKDNKASQRFAERVGFRFNTAIKDAHPSGALLIYAMHRKDCPWLNLKRKA